MSDQIRGATLALESSRKFLLRNIKLEHIISNDCLSTQGKRVTEYKRTEVATHSDGVVSIDCDNVKFNCGKADCHHEVKLIKQFEKFIEHGNCRHGNGARKYRVEFKMWRKSKSIPGHPSQIRQPDMTNIGETEDKGDCEKCFQVS